MWSGSGKRSSRKEKGKGTSEGNRGKAGGGSSGEGTITINGNCISDKVKGVDSCPTIAGLGSMYCIAESSIKVRGRTMITDDNRLNLTLAWNSN